MVSALGIIATCGVVVNGGLVLTVTMNEMIRQGLSPEDAALEATKRRFRPIMLTSLTTFIGLGPMIFETSPQARYLVPMAIALDFGILFSTVVVLILLPACYLIAARVRGFLVGKPRVGTAPNPTITPGIAGSATAPRS